LLYLQELGAVSFQEHISPCLPSSFSVSFNQFFFKIWARSQVSFLFPLSALLRRFSSFPVRE
jgi:hypothetical protein